jgi:hypothetical protein
MVCFYARPANYRLAQGALAAAMPTGKTAGAKAVSPLF